MNYDSDNGTAVSTSTATPKSLGNGLGRTGRDKDFLHIAETAKAFSGTKSGLTWSRARQALISKEPVVGEQPFASYTSPLITCRFPARQFLPSWNVKTSAGTGFRIYLRVENKMQETSPWFFVGEGGVWRKLNDEITHDPKWGEVRIDYLNLVQDAMAFQYKVDFIAPEQIGELMKPTELHRMFVHYSGVARRNCRNLQSPELDLIRLSVPYRSQLDVEAEDLRHIVCCPTCVAMVLESRGINKPTMEICDSVYCPRHDIFGVWPRASQAAFEHGVKAWIQRFRHINGVKACLLAGRPIIASIRVKDGELRGATYPKSAGHLIVLKGITETGKMLVNDPYSAGPGGHEIEYEIEDIEKCWLDCGGVAVMLD